MLPSKDNPAASSASKGSKSPDHCNSSIDYSPTVSLFSDMKPIRSFSYVHVQEKLFIICLFVQCLMFGIWFRYANRRRVSSNDLCIVYVLQMFFKVQQIQGKCFFGFRNKFSVGVEKLCVVSQKPLYQPGLIRDA